MDESPLSPDATRPNSGGSYVRLPDGSLMKEEDWLAAQAQAAATAGIATPPAEADRPAEDAPQPTRPARTRKEG